MIANPFSCIPVILEDAGLLAAFTHPSHIGDYVPRSDWRSSFAQLPPTRIFNDFGYIPVILEDTGLLLSLVHPSHIENYAPGGHSLCAVSPWPSRIFNDFGFIPKQPEATRFELL
jgi:hypothetical protein